MQVVFINVLYIQTNTNNLVERYEPREAVKNTNTHMKMWVPFTYSHGNGLRLRYWIERLEQDELLLGSNGVLTNLCLKSWVTPLNHYRAN